MGYERRWVRFEWDTEKVASNLAKHGVSFEEAKTIFGDPLATTVSDPDHSVGEDRWLTTGLSRLGNLLIVSHTNRDATVRIIGRERPHPERGGPMSQESNEPEMRPEYDIRGGVRGKYFDQYHERPSISIKFEASTLIVESTASAQQIGRVTNSGSSLPPSPSPKIVIGQPAPVACAG